MAFFYCEACDEIFDTNAEPSDILECPECETSLTYVPDDQLESNDESEDDMIDSQSKIDEQGYQEFITEDDEDILPKRTRLGGFEIINLIGQGGMGNVYTAMQLSMNRIVALKVLPQSMNQELDLIRQFLKEAKMSGAIAHPNVVTAIDAGEANGRYFLAMNYVNGHTLDEIIERDGVMSEEKVLKIGIKMCEALGYFWDRHSMLHKDIKPSNIMLDGENIPYLLDMGIAQRLTDKNEKKDHIEGSPFYMSPEQSCNLDLSWQTDMYSLGATLYNCLVGEPMYDDPDVVNIIRKHCTHPIPNPNEANPDINLSPATVQLLNKMLAKKPEERFESWTQLKIAMRKSLRALAGNTKKKVITPVSRKKRSAPSENKKPANANPRIIPKPKRKILPIINLISLIVVLTIGAYFGIKYKNESKLDETLKRIKNYLALKKTSLDNISDVKQLLTEYSIAKERSEKLFVSASLRQEVTSSYNNILKRYNIKIEESKKYKRNMNIAKENFKTALALYKKAVKRNKEEVDIQLFLKTGVPLLSESKKLLDEITPLGTSERFDYNTIKDQVNFLLQKSKTFN